ncbi:MULTISPECIES: beta-glucoside-specific PTS transporter subunit IIABC [Liquorilactobacillus]|uniref:PTS beta-glucoside transporter subunit EIIBCA n=3 Tax=Lactobacillaceae TaxID=33958 RepID=A0A3Q8CEY5_9LACO|nr:beta-glucoside-specific PTS transporter subunit IIABC [Liquorilactobacillus nagelii]AUJ31947.1 PTS beta-glucoside transporter subunit EIIBCA [Liquorilactobacillus nagelii]MCC7615088.1 PTS beta-glucoside transporter subunit EIIBCA [Liquorilactobacillus nagelii]MCP9314754.1 PTS glucose transporter subunit IIA [Liquorilactobacillus nagelii]
MNSNNLGKKILSLVGGENNIVSITHCATRLRMRLSDTNLASKNKEEIEDLNGVISVVEKAGQFQVVIGPNVPTIYDELIDNTSLNKQEEDKNVSDNTNWFLKVMDVVAGIFTPLLPLLAGSGVFRGLVLLATQFKWLSTTSDTYYILTVASTAVFYFLPILLAITSAEKFKVDKYVAAAIMGSLIMPEFTNMMGSHGNGVIAHFFGIPIVLMTYTSTVIPAILAIWCLSYLEKYLRKWIPESLQLLFVPLISLFLMVPLTAGIFGPFGVYIGEGISNIINWLINSNGWIAGAFIGGIWNIFVIFGLQWAVNPVMINNISRLGFDYIVPLTAAANFGMAGATLGTFLRTHDKKMKAYSMSALLSILFAGITEPSIYGVGIRYKRPLIGAVVGGAIGGAFIGGLHVKAFAFVFGGLTTLPAFVGSTFIYYVIGLAICFIVGCIVTLIIGINEKEAEKKEVVKNISNGNIKTIDNETISQPIDGIVDDIATATDPAFSSGSMGEGMVIQPSDGNVYAPFDGNVTMLFKTGHAIGITSNKGTEIMIHIGIDTVKLNGNGFKSFVKQGDSVTKGQKLISFDLEAIKNKGYDLSTFVIITNTDNYKEVQLLDTNMHKHGENILSVNV